MLTVTVFCVLFHSNIVITKNYITECWLVNTHLSANCIVIVGIYCLQLEKVLQQGDISEVTEPYMKDEKVCKGFEVSTK